MKHRDMLGARYVLFSDTVGGRHDTPTASQERRCNCTDLHPHVSMFHGRHLLIRCTRLNDDEVYRDESEA